MSLSIAVVPEDDRLDKHVLQPVFTAMCAYLRKPHARVRVVDSPHARGVNTVMNPEYVQKVMRRYPMTDAIIYCLDRDADPGRDTALQTLIEQQQNAAYRGTLAGGTAHQEVEVWCLALHVAKLDASWEDVRAHPHPKERFLNGLVDARGLGNSPGHGRAILGREAAKRYDLLRVRCPELQDFEQIIAAL